MADNDANDVVDDSAEGTHVLRTIPKKQTGKGVDFDKEDAFNRCKAYLTKLAKENCRRPAGYDYAIASHS